MNEPPLFTQAYSLFEWLLQHFERETREGYLTRVILETARHLLESLTLALQGFDRPDRAVQADEALALLRLHLRLAESQGLIDERQYAYLVQEMDEIGKQLGGWLKRMDSL